MKTWRYKIYLQVGNMSDILNMSLHDFRSVIDEMIYENTPIDKRFKKQSKSQKQMIKRQKEIVRRVK